MTDRRHLGAAHDWRTNVPHYRLWSSSHVHHSESFLVVEWTLYLRRRGERRGRRCTVAQPDAVAVIVREGNSSVLMIPSRAVRNGSFLPTNGAFVFVRESERFGTDGQRYTG